MSQLKLFVFGHPQVVLDDEHLEIKPRKALALLIYLFCQGGWQSRNKLATLFWPESSQIEARTALRRRLSELNKSPVGGWLEADRERVRVKEKGDWWLDVAQFKRAVEAYQNHGHQPDAPCPDCLKQLTTAARLYQDDFLLGFTLPDCPAFDDWQLFQTEEHRQTLSFTFQQLIRLHQAQDTPVAAIPYARRWLALNPLHEPAHQALMRLYAWSGDRAGALRQYDECVRILDEELGLPPEEETTALRGQIRSRAFGQRSTAAPEKAGQQPADLPAPPFVPAIPLESTISRHNLPAQTTVFIGRKLELKALADFLAEPTIRLVTILAPGGMGKTRLALETAGTQLDHFSHGVYFVSLAPLETPEPMVGAIAEALNFSFYEGGTPQQQLLDYLREKSILLVLDNFEHVLDGAKLVSAILQTAPAVKILTTSRERLQLSGETIFTLEGLAVPADELSADHGAVKLFIRTAHQRRPNYAPAAVERPAIRRICQLVQGMPLGIILAATWLELLTPAEIVDELAHNLDFLETELRDLPQRQRSMRAVFDHSWRLLSEPERDVFQQLTVFRGGFTRRAAETVTGASLRLLMSLVNKSLVQRESDGRFGVHELLRQYGAEKLAEDPARQTTVRDQHCAFYCTRLNQREGDLKGAEQLAALAEIEADLENVRRAWAWAIEHGNLPAIDQALESLYDFYDIQGQFQEGYAEFERAVIGLQRNRHKSRESSAESSEITLTKLLARQGAFGSKLGRYKAAEKQLQQSMALADRLDMRREQALCLNVLGDIKQVQGEHLAAEHLYQDSLAISQDIGDRLTQAASFKNLGWLNLFQGTPDQAHQFFLQSLTIYQDAEHQFGTAMLLDRVAVSALRVGRYEEAERLSTQSLAISKKLGSRPSIARALGGLGLIALGSGSSRLPRAKQLWQERLAIIQDLGDLDELVLTWRWLAHIHNELEEHRAAKKYVVEALKLSKRIGHSRYIAWCLNTLSEAEAGLNDYQAAWSHCYEALRIAVVSSERLITVQILVNLASLLAGDTNRSKRDAGSDNDSTLKTSNQERAIEILTLAMNHTALMQMFKDKAARLRTELAAELPPETVAAAIERGEAKTLSELIAEILSDSA